MWLVIVGLWRMAYGRWQEMAFRFEGLDVFQLAVDYAMLVYRVTKDFPRDEVFGMTANLRRAATSIAHNIAEGSGRGTDRDFAHFVDVAMGSLFETVASFIVAERLSYVGPEQMEEIRTNAATLRRKLNSFKKALATSHKQ